MTTWLDNPKGCGSCESCGMDMDMSPFCVNIYVVGAAEAVFARTFQYGLNINDAMGLCQGKYHQKKEDDRG